MKRMYWVLGACLSLLLIGGLAMDVSAQQSTPPAPSSAPTESKPDTSNAPAAPAPAAPSGQMERQQAPPSTNNNTQIETRSERIVERETSGGRIFGVDPMVAMVIGAVLLIVIVVGLVAMSKRTEDVHHHRV